jgi:hypothetical protein
MPARLLLFGTFFRSHSIVSYKSLLSSTSLFYFLVSMCGRISTNFPSDMNRPRTSW